MASGFYHTSEHTETSVHSNFCLTSHHCPYTPSLLNTILGKLDMQMCYNRCTGTHELVIVKGSGPTLLGPNWLTNIWLDWATVKMLGPVTSRVRWKNCFGTLSIYLMPSISRWGKSSVGGRRLGCSRWWTMQTRRH